MKTFAQNKWEAGNDAVYGINWGIWADFYNANGWTLRGETVTANALSALAMTLISALTDIPVCYCASGRMHVTLFQGNMNPYGRIRVVISLEMGAASASDEH